MTATQPPAQDVSDALRQAAMVLDLWEGEPDETGYMGDFNDAAQILLILADHAARELQQAQVAGELVTRPVAPHAANNAPSPSVQLTATPQSSAPVVGDASVFCEQMDMLLADFTKYERGDENTPFVVVRESLISALNEYTALSESALTGRGSP